MLRRTAIVVSTLALAAGTTAGCGDDGPDHLTAGDGFSVEAALAELPVPTEDGDGLTVVIFDLTAAAEANGAGERPTSEGEDLGRWLLTATGTATPEGEDGFPPVFLPPVDVLGSQGIAQVEEIEDEVGWSVLDVDAVAEATLPPQRFGVVTGDVGEDTFADAGLEPDEDGVVSVGEGEDGEVDPDHTSPARPLGAALRMAADGDRLAVSSSTEAAAEWLDGEAETLAEDDDLRSIAAALDDADALCAYLTVVADGLDFTAVGFGWSVEDGEPRMTLAFAYDDEGAAEGDAGEIEAALTGDDVADQVALDEVEVDEGVVVAHVRPGPEGRPQSALDMLIQRDGPFAG